MECAYDESEKKPVIKQCKSCRYFNEYYIRTVTGYARTPRGCCTEHSETMDEDAGCDEWKMNFRYDLGYKETVKNLLNKIQMLMLDIKDRLCAEYDCEDNEE